MAIKSVDAATLKTWLDRGEAALVDVREPAEFASESIQGAILLPLARVGKAMLPPYQGKKLVIQCRKGGRGQTACEKLLAEDPGLELYNLEGGIEAWRTSGFAVVSAGKKILPLDRQAQLTIGLCVLIASLLGFFVSANFFLITGFFGAGLTLAGLTGFCSLARLLAMAPWNQHVSDTASVRAS
jgi:rhodanese-related sulfurtransferase